MMSDKEIMRIVKGFTKGMLNKSSPESKCFMVCSPLHSYLSLYGLETKLIQGQVEGEKYIWGHFWLQLKDGRIIDPTAEQLNVDNAFNMPEIYFGEQPEQYTAL